MKPIMKPIFILTALSAAALAACTPAPDAPAPEPDVPAVSAPVTPTPSEATLPPETNTPLLTTFSPPTNEIYCSFSGIGDDGLPADRLFITEIGGVPAAAHVGYKGESVKLEEVSKDDAASPQVWVYRNDSEGVEVELNMTETGKGFESRDYEGTIQLTRPEAGPVTAITGTCGV